MLLLRKALANKYPAALASFQAPVTVLSAVKNAFVESKLPLSRPLSRTANPFTPACTRALYLCFADRRYTPPAVAPPDAFAGSGIEDDKIPKETIDAIERLLRISLREMLLPVFAAKLDEDAVVFDNLG